MKSAHNWPNLLHEFLASRMNAPFVWGKHDCCLFACDAVQAMTGGGNDLAADFRGKYDSALSAVRVMKDFTTNDHGDHVAITRDSGDSGHLVGLVAAKIAAQHQINEVPVLMAQRGDVALVLAARGESLGIVALDGISVLSPGESGLIRIPLKAALKVWRIPKG